jgi:PAP2 superfamily
MGAGNARLTRRKFAAALVVGTLLVTSMAACGDDNDETSAAARSGGLRAEPTAGRWKTWVVSPEEIVVPAPPEEGSAEVELDLQEVERLAEERTPQVREVVAKWSGPNPAQPWTETAFDFVSKSAKNPPLSSRNYALLHNAIHDAVLTAWHWKYRYSVDPPEGVDTLVPAGPDPSYPSEHAAIAGAASRVLAFLYPAQSALRLDEMAEEAGRSRVEAGTNTSSDVAAGLELGRKVAEEVIAYAKTDGTDRKWDGTRPPGIGGGPAFWEPPPGAASPPTEPEAAHWKPWVLARNDQFRPPPPPAYDSPEFRAAAQDVVDVGRNLTPEQQRIAKFWEGAEGTSLPAGIALDVAMGDIKGAASSGPPETRWTIPRVTRALAMVNVAMSDGGIAAWDGKFTYWNPRPENAIRDLGLDPNWKPYLPTPRFPAYPSGSAGYAGATEAVMTYLIPEKAAEFKRRADEQAISRVYAGIHWRYDAISLDAGRQIGNLVVERAKGDGADG